MKTIKINMLIAFVAIFSFAFVNATDLPAQIKAFVNQNRAFINKIKTIPACSNLYNVFAIIERDANTGLSADYISTRFNAAFGNDKPSGEALQHYITAYGLFSSAFKTDKVPFVNPSPKKTTEKETPPLTKLPWQKDYQLPQKEWDEMDLQTQKEWLSDLDIDAEKVVNDWLDKLEKENKKLNEEIKNQ